MIQRDQKYSTLLNNGHGFKKIFKGMQNKSTIKVLHDQVC